MRLLGRVSMIVGIVLGIGAAVLIVQGEHTRVNDAPLADYTGYAWAVFIVAIALVVGGARISRRSSAPGDDVTPTRP